MADVNRQSDNRQIKAAVVGIEALTLRENEQKMFSLFPPAGIILFKRNIQSPEQLSFLIKELREVLPEESLIMVDQEGGRVQRLQPPFWPSNPPMSLIGELYDKSPENALEAAFLTGKILGMICRKAGFDTVAAPVLDLKLPGMTKAIGDRAFHQKAEIVASLGENLAKGLAAARVIAVGKHAPGHGRALSDSHFTLPEVEEAELSADFYPFFANRNLPCLMTAHLIYKALDPVRPATLSPFIIQNIIRKKIGFQGLLMSDDLAMQALYLYKETYQGQSGISPVALATEALEAGCDLALYCSGEKAPTEILLAELPFLSAEAFRRLLKARAFLPKDDDLSCNLLEIQQKRDGILAWKAP